MSLDPFRCKVKYISWNYCSGPLKWLTVTLGQLSRCTRLHLSRRPGGSLPPEAATSKPLSGSSPSSPYYSNSPLYLLYISTFFHLFLEVVTSKLQAVVRFITINSSLSSPYCSSTPPILTNKKTSRAAKAADDVQVVEIWKTGGLHRAFNMKVNHKPHEILPSFVTNQILS